MSLRTKKFFVSDDVLKMPIYYICMCVYVCLIVDNSYLTCKSQTLGVDGEVLENPF